MAYLGQTFNAADHQAWGEKEELQLLPAGRYLAQIVSSDIVDTKAGNGQRLIWTVEVLDGEFTGRRLVDSINTRNHSDAAVTVGNQRLAMVCNALGIPSAEDSEQLHLIPFWAKVEHRKERAEITFYERRQPEHRGNAGAPRPAPGARSAPAQAPAQAPATKPWARI